MTAQALAEQLEVSERTIYRDIEALSFVGIPIYTERGPGGGYELLGGYQTKLTGLTAPEVRALFLLNISTPLADLGLNQALENALLKLSAALPTDSRVNATLVRQRVHVDMMQPTSKPVIPHLGLIQQAIWQDYTLCLTYRGYYRCLIDPYGLVSQQGVWYLVGVSAGMMQVVCVTHIQSAELTGQHFTCPIEFDLATYWAEHASRTNHLLTGDRGGQAQKKGKIKADAFIPMPSRRNAHTILTPNKKKFCLQCA